MCAQNALSLEKKIQFENIRFSPVSSSFSSHLALRPLRLTRSHTNTTNIRKSEMLHVCVCAMFSEAIPEENYTKSLPERDKHGAGGGGGGTGGATGGAALRRGPALIKASGTPKPTNGARKSANPQTTALLSSSSTDSEEDDDEDEDCGDEQHPI